MASRADKSGGKSGMRYNPKATLDPTQFLDIRRPGWSDHVRGPKGQSQKKDNKRGMGS